MKEINPKDTTRADAFEMWMQSPNPMVTFIKTLDVSRLVKISRRNGLKFNMLMCYCIGCAASGVKEFYMLPVGGKLIQFDSIAVNTIVNNSWGGINSCDIAFSGDLWQFNSDYLALTHSTAEKCESVFIDDAMIIGTSAMVATELDGIVNQYTDKFLNPMVMWGRYRKGWFKTTLPISFQFHHVQMDGAHAARFLERVQTEIDNLKI